MPKDPQMNLFEPVATASSASLLARGGVNLRETPCRSLLNRADISDYSFNCYTGCLHGCGYCYARFIQRFHPHDEPWGQFVDVKINAADVLARQIRRLPPGSVFACSACDGWQSIEQHYRLTRRCCELLLAAGFSLNVLTKSELVLRDLDIFTGREVTLGVSIAVPDEDLARLWEPAASPVSTRIRILKEARRAGLRTTLMFAPLLPRISDTSDSLFRLFEIARDAGVDRIITDSLNLRPRVWPSVQQLVRAHRPDLLPLYSDMLFHPAHRRQYLADLEARVAGAAAKAGLADRVG
jgi:DNA repair photolyase